LADIEDGGDDVSAWTSILNEIENSARNWLDCPWIIAEFYFYRRIISVFDHFTTLYDPFMKQKLNGTLSALPLVEDIARAVLNVDDWLHNADIVLFGLLTSLWGNKKDLSLWPAPPASSAVTATNTEESIPHPPQEQHEVSVPAAISYLRTSTASHILDNQTETVVRHLLAGPATTCRNVGIVVDNAGFELLCDFALGHILLTAGVAQTVTFHTKKHPTFVSDATTRDCMDTIAQLLSPSFGDMTFPRPCSLQLAGSWRDHCQAGRFLFKDDFFWCQPTPFDRMPDAIGTLLSDNFLTIVKV
jgi:hypothetical protein